MDANDAQIFASPYGTYGFGPSIDGDYVTHDPKTALSQGLFDNLVELMRGQNFNEGLLLGARTTNSAQYLDFIRNNFPTACDDAIRHIANDLWPPFFDGSMGDEDQIGRAALTMDEGTFVCNAFALNSAYGSRPFYLFGIVPGLHAQTLEHTCISDEVMHAHPL